MGAAAIPLAVTSIGLGVYQQERQASAQRKAMAKQAKVQKQQLAQQQAEQRRATVEERKKNQKRPEIAELLAGAEQLSRRGVAGTVSDPLGGKGTLLG